jgi:large subunit ribosomal protein L9
MKVLFKRDVPGVAKAGQVKDVADGHARNYLIPRGLAVPATAGTLKQVEQRRASDAKHAQEEVADARALKARLEGTPIVVRSRAGSQGRLYGSITNADVAVAIEKQLGIQLDRRAIDLPEPVRHVGTHTVVARLPHGVTASFTLDVQADAEG